MGNKTGSYPRVSNYHRNRKRKRIVIYADTALLTQFSTQTAAELLTRGWSQIPRKKTIAKLEKDRLALQQDKCWLPALEGEQEIIDALCPLMSNHCETCHYDHCEHNQLKEWK